MFENVLSLLTDIRGMSCRTHWHFCPKTPLLFLLSSKWVIWNYWFLSHTFLLSSKYTILPNTLVRITIKIKKKNQWINLKILWYFGLMYSHFFFLYTILEKFWLSDTYRLHIFMLKQEISYPIQLTLVQKFLPQKVWFELHWNTHHEQPWHDGQNMPWSNGNKSNIPFLISFPCYTWRNSPIYAVSLSEFGYPWVLLVFS